MVGADGEVRLPHLLVPVTMLKLERRACRELRSRKQSIELGQPVVPARDALGAGEEDMREFFIAVDLRAKDKQSTNESRREAR